MKVKILTDNYPLRILTIMIRMLVFLGNPGKEYASTRHNAGFLLCDYLYPDAIYQMKFHSQFMKAGDVYVIRPMTFMNLSGTAVSEAASFYHMAPEEIMVIHDDLELPLGKARLQKGGGLQGHNGLRSIKDRLGTGEFYRLRIGIGRPEHGDVRIYVTSPFRKDEMITINQLFQKLRPLLSAPGKQTEVSIDA